VIREHLSAVSTRRSAKRRAKQQVPGKARGPYNGSGRGSSRGWSSPRGLLTLILLLVLPFIIAGITLSYSLDYDGPHHEVCQYSARGRHCDDEPRSSAELDTVYFHQPSTIQVTSQAGLWIARLATWLSSLEILALVGMFVVLAARAIARRLKRPTPSR
jgi:hypothetical protein